LIKFETITKDGDKVLAHTIAKKLEITMEELVSYAQELGIKITFAQQIMTLEEAKRLAFYIETKKQKLHFDGREWVNNSIVDEFQNLIKFIDETLNIIDIQLKRNEDSISKANYLYLNILEIDEKSSKTLAQIKRYLLFKFEFSLEELKERLFFMKLEAIKNLEIIESNHSIFKEKTPLEKEINFNFAATKIARLYENRMKNIKNISSNETFISKLLDSLRVLQIDEEKFKNKDLLKLSKSLEGSSLKSSEEKFSKEWLDEVEKLNEIYIKLLEYYFVGMIPQSLIFKIYRLLHDLKVELEDFYLSVRPGLSLKYSKRELKEELEARKKLLKIYESSLEDFFDFLKEKEFLSAKRVINQIICKILTLKIPTIKEIKEEDLIFDPKYFGNYLFDLGLYQEKIKEKIKELENKTLT